MPLSTELSGMNLSADGIELSGCVASRRLSNLTGPGPDQEQALLPWRYCSPLLS